MQLITGGTGIVGIHLLHLLTSCGHSVRALVRPGSDRRIVERVFRHYSTDPNELLARITWVEGDLHDMSSLEDAMVGVERVYHAAALVSFDPRELRELRRTNIEGTAKAGLHQRCLDGRQSGLRRGSRWENPGHGEEASSKRSASRGRLEPRPWVSIQSPHHGRF